MLNRGLLIDSEKQCKRAYGVGVYPGDRADLIAMGLSPMEGCEDPASENFGNYIHTDGSVMVFIPAFVYRFGRASAPSFSRDGENAVEIKFAPDVDIPAGTTDVNWSPGDGWVLARAFIDGGRVKRGFFIDKYLCSKSQDGQSAISVKAGIPLSLTTQGSNNSASMPGCEGKALDAFALGRSRGDAYACVSAFQWAAISLLSLAWGQQVKSTSCCAWYDSSYQANFPKGFNNDKTLSDSDDGSIRFEVVTTGILKTSKTGTGVPFEKTTHNGHKSGVSDVNGSMACVLIGVVQGSGGSFYVLSEASKMHDVASKGLGSRYEAASGFSAAISARWGSAKTFAFMHDSSGVMRAMCAVYPPSAATSGSGEKLFGEDLAIKYAGGGEDVCPITSGGNVNGHGSGIWARDGDSRSWDYLYSVGTGLRVAGYAN